MVLLKHLCREFNIEPYQLRKRLRARGFIPTNRRWRWQENDPTLTDVRTYLSSSSAGATTSSSGSSPAPHGELSKEPLTKDDPTFTTQSKTQCTPTA